MTHGENLSVQWFKCRGPCGETKPEYDFSRSTVYKGKTYRRSICRDCVRQLYYKYELKRVPISKVRPFMDELVFRAGSVRKAGNLLGVSNSQIRQWLALAPRYYNDGKRIHKRYATHISKESAALIFKTLQQVRQEQEGR